MPAEKILVAYASRTRTAEEVACQVARVLAERGNEVDVRPVKRVRDLSPYRAVVLGTAVRAGRVLPEALRFVKKREAELRQRPFACFVVCLTMVDDTDANREKVAGWLIPIWERVSPVAVGLFAGAAIRERLGFVLRSLLRMLKAPMGDHRDWEAIRRWAAELDLRSDTNT